MKAATRWWILAATALLPLVVLSYLVAWGSVKRLYVVYLFAHGQSPSDDLLLAHVDVPLELTAWGIVLVAIILTSFIVRYLLRSRQQAA